MAFNQSTEAINVEEHDGTFGVKKVELFLQTGANLTQAAGTTGGAMLTAGGGYGTVVSDNATNNTHGTAVQLPNHACKMVRIFAPTGNSGQQVAVGDSGSLAALGSEKGDIIISGGSRDYFVTNSNLLYFDVITNGDKISILTFN